MSDETKKPEELAPIAPQEVQLAEAPKNNKLSRRNALRRLAGTLAVGAVLPLGEEACSKYCDAGSTYSNSYSNSYTNTYTNYYVTYTNYYVTYTNYYVTYTNYYVTYTNYYY